LHIDPAYCLTDVHSVRYRNSAGNLSSSPGRNLELRKYISR
jgi:hypothetical protein